ncbi:MAG: tyrosine-type recombinase/integrase [Cetobacterium sp.]
MQKKTRDISEEELKLIMSQIKQKDVKLLLYLEANLGFRIGDTLQITRSMIQNKLIKFNETKTKKDNQRVLTSEEALLLLNYIDNNKIEFKQVKEFEQKEDYKKYVSAISRKVQRAIKDSCKINNIDNSHISSHSFRKYYATTVYRRSNNDIMLVSQLLNHSSVAITQKYLGIDKAKLKEYSFLNSSELN